MTVKIEKAMALGSLSLTPLIDIVFLLLIFFLVSTRFAEEDRELDVDLPTASEAQPLVATPREIFINIDQEGRFFLGNQQMGSVDLRRQLERLATNNPLNQTAVVRADRHCDWQHVATAFDICQSAGIQVRPTTQPGDG
jgi:biopolymer transport protein ExbD